MSDFDTTDILTLRCHRSVRICISFQVVSMDGASRMFSRATELIPGEDMTISLYNDLIEVK